MHGLRRDCFHRGLMELLTLFKKHVPTNSGFSVQSSSSLRNVLRKKKTSGMTKDVRRKREQFNSNVITLCKGEKNDIMYLYGKIIKDGVMFSNNNMS